MGRGLFWYSGGEVSYTGTEAGSTESVSLTRMQGSVAWCIQVSQPVWAFVLLPTGGFVMFCFPGKTKWHQPAPLLLERHLCEDCLLGKYPERSKEPPHCVPQALSDHYFLTVCPQVVSLPSL